MGFYRKFRPSKSQAIEFAQKMEEIEKFCDDNKISKSYNSDSYYFTIDGQKYRISNHSVESRNKNTYLDPVTFQEIPTRGYKLDDFREDDTIYIHASKTRIIEIYNNLKNGYKLDGKGKIKK